VVPQPEEPQHVDNGDGGIAHYAPDDQRRAYQEAENDEWHILRDGRVYCTATKCEALLPACVCESGDCNYRCPVGCPCPLHAEVTPVVLPGQLEIGGAA
jgi:hypothetical protein